MTLDLMVRSEDAPKINRIVERFNLGAVSAVSIQNDTAKEKEKEGATQTEPDIGVQSKEETDKLLEDLFAQPTQKEEQQNPSVAKTEKSPPSEPSSESLSKTTRGTTKADGRAERPSVRKELNEIKAEKNVQKETMASGPRGKLNGAIKHEQPKGRKAKRRGKAR